jgi:pimeloyl-ACP methyl ester carboxylesterase
MFTKGFAELFSAAHPLSEEEATAQRLLRPAADVVELAGVGHYPQVEVPEQFTAQALALLGG